MKTLTLPVKREYFEQIKSGKKRDEYRLVTPYWRKRLEGRSYDRVVVTLGYPKAGDASRRIERPWTGFKVKTITHPHFGEHPVLVYAIKVSEPAGEGVTVADKISCPACEGKGTVFAHLNRGENYETHEWTDIQCFTCKGEKTISPEHQDRIKKGALLRIERIERGQTLYDAAAIQGLSPAQLSAIERGDKPPTKSRKDGDRG